MVLDLLTLRALELNHIVLAHNLVVNDPAELGFLLNSSNERLAFIILS
jgi:hypothetical protein